ncbi:hypothetical protein [Citrobacter arsenatis]|uniref:hypothetical protein n=1 Tax=Citrobacter arsenatis TaxID=2546350 RepID=UPI001FE7D9D9|nr:hypothetical protein [Citrobacter arsenatis]
MNRTDAPAKQAKPFGINGQREPLLATTPAGDNTASYEQGFPPITMILKSAGGLPPKGQDMNQILYELSALSRWASSGALNSYDPSFSTAISGYPKGAMLLGNDGTTIYISTADANTNNPNSSTTNWLSLAKITSISALAGGADKLPYFTGTSTAGQTDFTPAARSLLARDSADGMLNYLGTGTAAKKNAQTNVTDSTVGSLMLVGAFGFGGVGASTVNTNITNIYTLPIGDAGNPDPFQNYVHLNLSGTSFYSSRIALSMNGTDNPRIFIKNRSGATESDWAEVYTTRNPPASVPTLTTARNISISGDATGSAPFNGSADANISVTVADSAKGVIRLREGSVSTVGTSSTNFIAIDTGLLIRGITFTAGAQTVNVRPLQMLINTTWVTVGLS